MPVMGSNLKLKWAHTDTTNAERATRIVCLIGLNKGRYMNSADFIIVITITGIMAAFIKAAYTLGYRHGHGEGYIRGRAIVQALKEKNLI